MQTKSGGQTEIRSGMWSYDLMYEIHLNLTLVMGIDKILVIQILLIHPIPYRFSLDKGRKKGRHLCPKQRTRERTVKLRANRDLV